MIPEEFCLECPVHATCDGYDIICSVGYKLSDKRDACIEDNMFATKARAIVDRFQHRLEELQGMYICGQIDDPMLSKAKLESDINEEYPS